MSTTSNRLAASPMPDTAGASLTSSPSGRLAAYLRRLWAAYWAYQVRRAIVHMRRALDDRSLRDIGLTR